VTLSQDLVRRFPKAELHVHLDGCLRPQTMLDLAREQGVRLPATDAAGLADALFVRHAQSLEEYLERYTITISVMQTPAALERIAYEFVQDAAADNIRYVEVRYCPALHDSDMSLVQAVEAPLEGFQRGERETGTIVRVIVCGLRTLAPKISEALARMAVDYRTDGVVAFDLAGSEFGHPAADHVAAFEYARGHGLACTCHAGEGDGPESIRDALHVCGAQRIGHGTRLFEDPDLEDEVLSQGVPLEVCLTSNVHTHTVLEIGEHPARRYLDRGGVVTLNTDSRLMDRTTLSQEYWLAHQALGLTRAELETVILNGFRSAFLPDTEKAALVAQIERELREVR
jgi:adenosine deaminase